MKRALLPAGFDLGGAAQTAPFAFVPPPPKILEKWVQPAHFVLKFAGMEIRVKVPDELAAQAQTRGVRVEVYVEEILARQVARPAADTHPRTPEQIRAWLDALAQFSDRIPPLPETISRDWIYQDHD